MAARYRIAFLVFAAFTGPIALAQRDGWYFSGFTGKSEVILGSHDYRSVNAFGGAYSFGYHPRLRWGRRNADLLLEGYYELSRGGGLGQFGYDSTSAFGVLSYARYRWGFKHLPTAFVDVGWGIQYQGRTSHDLASKFNSTPLFDFGFEIGKDPVRAVIGYRFMHVSNGDTMKSNDGQNHSCLLIQIPF